jgi:hypothetical protein
MTHGSTGALLCREARFGAMGQVAASEPSLAGRHVWIHRTRGRTKALLCREAGSRAAGHMIAPEPSSVGRWGPELRFT